MAFDDLLGSLLIAGLVATALWGITCAQTFTYFTQVNKDRPLFRKMIIFLWLLDTFDSILNGHILYFYLVTNYLNPLSISTPVWSVLLHIATTSASNYIIRSMFTLRVFRLSGGKIPITLWMMLISLTDLISGIIITVKGFQLSASGWLELDKFSIPVYISFAAGTTSDLSVAITLAYLLYRSRTGIPRTDSLIKTLMMYSINTGMIVAIDAILCLITYIIMPHNFVFLGFYLLLSKLYLNSYLASLNARKDLLEKFNEPISIHLSHSSDLHQRHGVESSTSHAEMIFTAPRPTGPSHTKLNAASANIDSEHNDAISPSLSI
ncbi:hypothetical protein BD779DRAFT_1521127, partial [Infundibulicybe gibba]